MSRENAVKLVIQTVFSVFADLQEQRWSIVQHRRLVVSDYESVGVVVW